jgi:hypothetical protein
MSHGKRGRVKGLADALTEDACPLCQFLKEFQSAHLRNLSGVTARHLCSYHLWSVAAASEVKAAAEIFLELLENSNPGESHACDLCKRVADEERIRVEEFSGYLRRPEFEKWLREYGALCLPHSRKLSAIVPQDLQKDIHRAVERHSEGLKQKLTAVLNLAREGKPFHAGVLGRAAEFLAAQRGLERDQ